MRRVRAALLVVAVASVAFAGTPARAQSAAVCTFTAVIKLSPGTSVTPNKGQIWTGPSYNTYSQTGTIVCEGLLDGANVPNGAGTVGFRGNYGVDPANVGDDCVNGYGVGDLAVTIPTSKGTSVATGKFTFARAGVMGAFEGNAGPRTMGGTFQFLPTKGDCAQKNVTEALVNGQAIIASS